MSEPVHERRPEPKRTQSGTRSKRAVSPYGGVQFQAGRTPAGGTHEPGDISPPSVIPSLSHPIGGMIG